LRIEKRFSIDRLKYIDDHDKGDYAEISSLLCAGSAVFFASIMAASTQSVEKAAEDESLDNETAEHVLFMFVQEAANETSVKNEDGNYTLTLLNVVPYTMYFSDRPAQIAGFLPMEPFIQGFDRSYPNAALSLVDADENMDAVILALSSPRYDNQKGALTYKAKLLEDLVSDRLSYHNRAGGRRHT
jgi:hypothetical protein